jgi:molybdopterin molybdotransferase
MTRPCAATLDFERAFALMSEGVEPLGMEDVRLEKAGRRILAQDVVARIDSPRADVAAMDGFAIRRAELLAGRTAFAVVGASFPALPFAGPVAAACAVRITTGAAMPEGLDQVLPIECVTTAGEQVMLSGAAPTRGHVRPRASDIARGDILLRKGQRIEPRTMLVAAAGDLATLPVVARPRMHLLTTGDELVAPGQAAERDGAVPDSLAEALLLLSRQWGARPMGAARLPDDPAAIVAAAEPLIDDFDVLVIAGGASRGERDFARAALAPLELEPIFAGVAMKPGKPLWYGRIGARHVLGLPGNPTAALTTARLFLVPLLARLGGQGIKAGLAWQAAMLGNETPPPGDREQFLCGWWDGTTVEILGRQQASAQLMLARANCLVRLGVGEKGLARGASVPILRL